MGDIPDSRQVDSHGTELILINVLQDVVSVCMSIIQLTMHLTLTTRMPGICQHAQHMGKYAVHGIAGRIYGNYPDN